MPVIDVALAAQSNDKWRVAAFKFQTLVLLRLEMSDKPNNNHQIENDIFLSYNSSIESQVEELYTLFNEYYQVNIYMKTSEEQQNQKQIQNSKIILCFLTRTYINSRKCINELTYAYANDKKILVVVFDNLNLNELNTVAFAMDFLLQFDLNKLKVSKWLVNEIVLKIKKLHGCKIIRLTRQERKEIEYLKEIYDKLKQDENCLNERNGDDDSRFQKIIKEKRKVKTDEAKSTVPVQLLLQITSNTASTEVYIPEYCENEHKINEILVDNNSKFLNLKKLKSTSLVLHAFGFNRFIYIDECERFYITSSYNHSIIVVNKLGNWIEKRNPGNLLKQPCGICMSSSSKANGNEIYVGDNGTRCIYVFNTNLHFIRKFAERTLNGFFDLALDEHNQEIYACDFYDGLVGIISVHKSVLLRKIYICTPSFVRLTKSQIVVASSSSNFIYSLNKRTLEINFIIKIKNSEDLQGLFVDSNSNIYTTVHYHNENDDDVLQLMQSNDKTHPNEALLSQPPSARDVYLCFISSTDRLNIRKLNIGLIQVNDIVSIKDNRLVFINDTHLEIFEYTPRQD